MAQEISILVRFAYCDLPSLLREGIAKDAFIEAFSDTELELVVFQRHPKSHQEAVELLRKYRLWEVSGKSLARMKVIIMLLCRIKC